MTKKMFSLIAVVVGMLLWVTPVLAQSSLSFSWPTDDPVNGQKYYLYNNKFGKFLVSYSATTSNAKDATLFTIKRNDNTITLLDTDWRIEIVGNNKDYYLYSGLFVGAARYLGINADGYTVERKVILGAVNEEEQQRYTWCFVSEAQFNAIYPKQVFANANLTSASFSNWTTDVNLKDVSWEGQYDSEKPYESFQSESKNSTWFPVRFGYGTHIVGKYMSITLTGIPEGDYTLVMNGLARNTGNLKTYEEQYDNVIEIQEGEEYTHTFINANGTGIALKALNANDDNIEEYTIEGVHVGADRKIVIDVNVERPGVNYVIASIKSIAPTTIPSSSMSVSNGVLNVIGSYTIAEVNERITSEEGLVAVDLTKAFGVNGEIDVTKNPNLLIYSRGGQVNNDKNVISFGLCGNLSLVDAKHAAGVPYQFLAKKASYEMGATAGGILGTIVLPFDANLPQDGKAFELTENMPDNGVTIMGEPVENLSANKPAIVTKEGTYTASRCVVNETDQNTAYTHGNLTGVYNCRTAPVGSYVLQNHTEDGSNYGVTGVGFYLVTENSNTSMRPFRAYIKAQQNTDVKAYKILLGGEETSVGELQSNVRANNSIYDLSGRRVSNPAKGIYIINGKKVVLN